MIKIATALVTLTLTMPFLNEASASEASLNGFSFFVRGGYTSGEAKTDRSTVSGIPANNIKDSSNISLKGSAIGAGILYGHVFDNFIYSGIEVDNSWIRGKAKSWTAINFGNPIGTTFKITHSYGASLRLGYFFKGWLPYLKLGALKSKISSRTEIMPLIGSGSTSKYLNGFIFGLGAEVPLNERISLGGELSRVEYKKLSYDVLDINNIKVTNVKSRLRENRVTLCFKFKLFHDFTK